ncbi:MAG: TetR family transcriptional regulator [Actinomycetota bacterium]|nr:TetR family transcriptional regulator [Actinomycetota bacterium]
MPREAGARRAGRRPGTSGTRDAILLSARRHFAELGYDRATLRAIAAEAGVDPALVAHFFGSKQRLFLSVVELPFEPAEVLPGLLSGDRESVGERMARFAISVLDDPEARARVVGMVRAAASEPEAARMLRELLTRSLFTPIAEALGEQDAMLRANLTGSQIVGLVMARHVVGVEPLASLEGDALAAAIAPTLQRYLTAPLG